MAFHFINVIWGEAYTELYLNVVLPTQLSMGNLPSFRDVPQSVYKIYTTPKDAETIINSKVYSLLSEIIETKVQVFNLNFDFSSSTYKYKVMNYCHQHAVIEANKDNCTLVFLAPDAILADGGLKNLIRLEAEGKRTVMIGGMRLTKETFVPAFLEQFNPNGNPSVSVCARELVKLSLDHLHPATRSLFWASKNHTGWPSHIYWNIQDEGLLARCFHLHPLMLNPLHKNVVPSNTIDFYYLESVCPDFDDIYVASDSDEIFAFEISALPKEKGVPILKVMNTQKIADWASNFTTRHHRYFLNYKIRVHSEESSDRWNAVEEESDEIVAEIQSYLAEIPAKLA